MRARHLAATAEGGSNAPALGYGKPEGMSNEGFGWLTGAHHMFPNEAGERGVPAINEPHDAGSGISAQRRAEDLSGPELQKGKDILRHYGHDPRDPIGSVKQTQDQNLQRVIGEHAAAGVDESASQHFYGGNRLSTQIPDSDLQAEHKAGMRAAPDRFQKGVETVLSHPQFSGGSRENATNVMAQATADTSPNTKWRDKNDRWPNMEQAEESVRGGLTGDKPKFISGRIQNVDKAAGRVADMEATGDYSIHNVGNQKTAPKTIAFRGALVDQNAADAYKVTDVHEGSQVFPGLPTAKSTVWKGEGDKGKTVLHPDQPKKNVAGKEQLMKTLASGKQKPEKGNSRVEEAIGKGPQVHAINDYATRQTLADHGLSRGVNYADNVHAMQGATWGSQQVKRPDVFVSHSDQYPVARDWAAEGSAKLNDIGEQVFGGRTRNLSPQFVNNPNTKFQENPTRKPYPIEG
jgi:hypothetical protein